MKGRKDDKEDMERKKGGRVMERKEDKKEDNKKKMEKEMHNKDEREERPKRAMGGAVGDPWKAATNRKMGC